MQTIKIDEVLVLDRQRIDLGDIPDLAKSIAENGVILPIVLSPKKRLIDGKRRIEACKSLGWDKIPFVIREDPLTEDQLQILELEADIRRKDRTWQERCLSISKIHRLKRQAKAKDSETWGVRETADLLGVDSTRDISWALQMATILEGENPHGPYWACESISEAFRLLWYNEESELNAELARRNAEKALSATEIEEEQTLLTEFETIEASPDALAEERERYYSNPHNPPNSFEEYWKEKQDWAQQARQTIHLSSRFHNTDAIKFMNDNPGRFDHVITDIPYGIDLDMISQSANEFVNIETVEELHDPEYNKQLIADFFPAAFRTTKDKAFVITWADQMLWQFMYDCAIKAGFAVQRWPITWIKTSSCLNRCVAYNTTKNTEIAIVCRKKGATLAWQPQDSTITASNMDALTQELAHPFSKCFAVWERLVKMATLENESILEPFAGHGSGVISMLKLNRIVTGVELDTNHYNRLLENVKNLYYLPINPNFVFK